MVTAGTYQKTLHFNDKNRLDFLLNSLHAHAREFNWRLQAWAIMANHYHFIARSESPQNLAEFVTRLHIDTAKFVNGLDDAKGRRVWFQYWDSHITYAKSYYARLRYVHHNPVHHGIVPLAEDYDWCSAEWFKMHADTSFRKTVNCFKIDQLSVSDDF
jgi:putative transposase